MYPSVQSQLSSFCLQTYVYTDKCKHSFRVSRRHRKCISVKLALRLETVNLSVDEQLIKEPPSGLTYSAKAKTWKKTLFLIAKEQTRLQTKHIILCIYIMVKHAGCLRVNTSLRSIWLSLPKHWYLQGVLAYWSGICLVPTSIGRVSS